MIISGILFAIFNAALGGNATFKQVFTVVVHAGPIGVLAQLFTVPLNYARGTMTSATNLYVLVQSFVDETTFAGRLLGMIDLFLVWQLIVLSMGLAVLYRRRTQPIATTLLVLYAVIAVIVAFVRRGAWKHEPEQENFHWRSWSCWCSARSRSPTSNSSAPTDWKSPPRR